jgi:hypothetical protein
MYNNTAIFFDIDAMYVCVCVAYIFIYPELRHSRMDPFTYVKAVFPKKKTTKKQNSSSGGARLTATQLKACAYTDTDFILWDGQRAGEFAVNSLQQVSQKKLQSQKGRSTATTTTTTE